MVHRLEFEAPASSRKVSIRTHEFMAAPHVTIDSGGQKFYFLKVELFGYRDGAKDYRFFNNQAYEIVDTAGFYIYCRTGYQKGKSSRLVTSYYFSKNGSDSLLALSVENLKAAFPDYAAFHYTLDCQCYHDGKPLDPQKVKAAWAAASLISHVR